ncbi:Uncharacterized protein QTN25_009345 [Entamoeba marina]
MFIVLLLFGIIVFAQNELSYSIYQSYVSKEIVLSQSETKFLTINDKGNLTIYYTNGFDWLPLAYTINQSISNPSIIYDNNQIIIGDPTKGSITFYQLNSKLIQSYSISTNTTGFGSKLLLIGDFYIISSPNENFGDYQCGIVYVFYSNKTFCQYLIPSNIYNNVGYGSILKSFGNLLIIGNKVKYIDVYLFLQNKFSLIQTILSPLEDKYNSFGSSVTIWGDYIIISSPTENENNGVIFVYQYNKYNSTHEFILTQTIYPPKNEFSWYNSKFGNSVSMNGDKLWVSAPTLSMNGLSSLGVIIIYQLINGQFHYSTIYKAQDIDTNKQFGLFLNVGKVNTFIGSYTPSTNWYIVKNSNINANKQIIIDLVTKSSENRNSTELSLQLQFLIANELSIKREHVEMKYYCNDDICKYTIILNDDKQMLYPFTYQIKLLINTLFSPTHEAAVSSKRKQLSLDLTKPVHIELIESGAKQLLIMLVLIIAILI